MNKAKTKNPEISIIVTAHNEGILAHKTMLSIFRSAKKLEDKNISYEIIVHIDNGTKPTVEYFSQYAEDKRFIIIENSLGDPALSRNYSVKKANGKYVTCIDADDLCSENWFLDAYEIVKKDKNNIARFNFVLTFGGEKAIISEYRDMSDEEKILYMIDSSLYGSPFMCLKDLYLKSPQRPNSKPYAYEDWQWNLDMMSVDGEYKVVPGAALFYRQDPLAKVSVLNTHNSWRPTLSSTKTLSFESLKGNKKLINLARITDDSPKQQSDLRRWSKETIFTTAYYLNQYRAFRFVKRGILKIYKPKRLDIPEVLLDEWKSINKIEKLTKPDEKTIKEAISWLPNKQAGVNYIQIIDKLNKKPDTLFFVPWLIKGGADKVFINTANEISKNHKDWNVAMMQTLVHESLWTDKLSKDIDFIDIANIMQSLDYENQMRLMAMFVSQNKIKRLIIANSKFAYDFVLRYKSLIENMNIKLYVFAFAETVDQQGNIGGYVHEELPLIEELIYKKITDNNVIVDDLHRENAISKDNFFVHHQFLSNKFIKPKNRNDEKIKVLWASRVSKSKLPELFINIANELQDSDFIFDIYGELEDGYTKGLFTSTNVNYIRSFNGVDDLPTDEYDIFLYTSNADGLPNMLLEIGSKGLPIIAPDVGGIKDFVRNNETGIVVDNFNDAEAYIEALKTLKDSKLRNKLAENAQELLKTEFSEEKWKSGVKEIFDK